MIGYSTKAELCREIQRLVGNTYGKKLWTLTNQELEEILVNEIKGKEIKPNAQK